MDLFSQTIKAACSVGLPQISTEKSRELTGATVMASSSQFFLQVYFLCCVVTTSIGGTTDWQKAFSQLENKVKQLEKRLEPLEAKGKFANTISSPYSSCLIIRTILLLTLDLGYEYTSLYTKESTHLNRV